MIRLWLALLICAGCPHPLPPPPDAADAGPADLFTGATVDCGLRVVREQRTVVLPSVETCLLGPSPSTCLVGLAGIYAPDSVACVVRDRGAWANAVTAFGDAGIDEATMAAAARAWIRGHRLGYR